MRSRDRTDPLTTSISSLGSIGRLGGKSHIPKGTTDVVMERLFPQTRAEVDTSEERRLVVYDYLDMYKALPEHFVQNPGEFDVRIKWNSFIPHAPQEKQHAYLWQPPDRLMPDGPNEGMYGGQAGGGKSDGVLMAALQYVDVPDYAALILRQSFPDLSQPGAIMTRAKEWLLSTDAKWNENQRTFTFPSGAKLVFGFLKRDDDVYQYQSAEYQFIGFDELTQFSEFQYTYMKSRLRRLEGSNVPLRMRSATNPGGKGHQWVRRYFVERKKDPTRFFIPASLDDNKFLDTKAYKISLEGLDPYTRAQLLHGDWTARPPGNWAFDHVHLDAVFDLGEVYFHRWLAEDMPPPVGGKYNLGLDFGEASHVVFGHPVEMGGYWLPKEHVYEHGEPDREADAVLEKLGVFGFPLDRSRFDSSKPESMRLFYRTLKTRRGPEFGRPSPVPFNKYKRAAILHFRGMASRTAWGERFGTLGISAYGCPDLNEQLYELQFKGEDTEDLVKEHDHGPDAVFSLLAPEIKHYNPPDEANLDKIASAQRERQIEEEKAQEASTLASG